MNFYEACDNLDEGLFSNFFGGNLSPKLIEIAEKHSKVLIQLIAKKLNVNLQIKINQTLEKIDFNKIVKSNLTSGKKENIPIKMAILSLIVDNKIESNKYHKFTFVTDHNIENYIYSFKKNKPGASQEDVENFVHNFLQLIENYAHNRIIGEAGHGVFAGFSQVLLDIYKKAEDAKKNKKIPEAEWKKQVDEFLLNKRINKQLKASVQKINSNQDLLEDLFIKLTKFIKSREGLVDNPNKFKIYVNNQLTSAGVNLSI